MKELVLIGAGGHGKVVAEAAQARQEWGNIRFLDDKHPELTVLNSWQVTGIVADYVNLSGVHPDFAVCIGDNNIRLRLIEKIVQEGLSTPSIIHPAAFVSHAATLQDATVVMAQAAINIDARIGTGCIINTGATVDHDCVLEDGVHVSPGSHLAGGVSVGERSVIGIGAVVLPNISIGREVVVGAGAVVLCDIEDGQMVIGNPAKLK